MPVENKISGTEFYNTIKDIDIVKSVYAKLQGRVRATIKKDF